MRLFIVSLSLLLSFSALLLLVPETLGRVVCVCAPKTKVMIMRSDGKAEPAPGGDGDQKCTCITVDGDGASSPAPAPAPVEAPTSSSSSGGSGSSGGGGNSLTLASVVDASREGTLPACGADANSGPKPCTSSGAKKVGFPDKIKQLCQATFEKCLTQNDRANCEGKLKDCIDKVDVKQDLNPGGPGNTFDIRL